MKIWLAYKFRGSDLNQLRIELDELKALLEKAGHQVITMIKDIQGWDPNSMSKDEVVRRAYVLAKECEIALCIYPTEDSSEGRGWDAGYFAGMGKPTVMAIHHNISIPYTEALYSQNPANKEQNLPGVIRYRTYQDILVALAK